MSPPCRVNSIFLSTAWFIFKQPPFLAVSPSHSYYETKLSAVISGSVWAAERSLSLSLISLIPALCHQHLPCCWRWSEDWRGFGERRGGTADAKRLYVIFCLTAFSCVSHFPLQGSTQRERRTRLVFVLHSPTQREIFIRSSSEIERPRGRRRGERQVDWETDRRRGNRACVFICLHIPQLQNTMREHQYAGK